MKLATLDDLSTTAGGRAAALKILKSAGIPCIHGYYDQDRLDAHLAISPELQRKRLEWGIAPTHGIGAIKSCFDAADLKIAAHYLRGANYFDILERNGQKRYVKLYYTNSASEESTVAAFTFTNFLVNTDITTYAACAINIPAIWLIPRQILIKAWDRLVKHKNKPEYRIKEKGTTMRLTPEGRDHEGGQLFVKLSIKDTRYVLPLPTLSNK